MAKKFTALSLAALKPETKRYEVGDIEPGLYIRVTPNGAKSFVVRYKFLGKVRRLTLGTVEDLSLGDARDAARDAMRKVRAGSNPAVEKQEIKAAKIKEEKARLQIQTNLVETALESYIELHARNLESGDEVARMLRFDVIPNWEGRDIRSIAKADVLALLSSIKGRGAKTMANRVLSNLRAFFNWAIANDYAGLIASPCQGVKAPTAEVKRSRVLNDDELRLILLASRKLDAPWGAFFRLLVYTGVRRGEAAKARWSEFSLLSNEKPEWLIPETRTKNNRPHLLPLLPDVVSLLKRVARIEDCDFVFSVTGKTPLAGFSDAKERLERLIIEIAEEEAEEKGIEPMLVPFSPWRIHDLRRTVATGMAGLEIAPHVVEAVLNHVSGAMAGVAGIYNRHGYYAEKKQALELWADHIARLESGLEQSCNVIPIRK